MPHTLHTCALDFDYGKDVCVVVSDGLYMSIHKIIVFTYSRYNRNMSFEHGKPFNYTQSFKKTFFLPFFFIYAYFYETLVVITVYFFGCLVFSLSQNEHISGRSFSLFCIIVLTIETYCLDYRSTDLNSLHSFLDRLN